MRSPRYLYRLNSFIFSIKIGSFLFLLWSFSSRLTAESYSSYLFDDFKAQNDWGRVKVNTQNRADSLPLKSEEGFQTTYKIFTASNFRSQKGGTARDEAGKYMLSGSGNSEVNFYYRSGFQSFSLLIGPRLSASESKIYETNKTSVWDTEGIFSYAAEFNKLRIALEGGRGWQRLDGFGFLFNGMANYGQFQIGHSDLLSFSLLSMSFKPEDESLNPQAWNHQRNEMAGLAIRSTDKLYWENFQVFHYQYSEPIHTQSQSALYPSYQFGSFLYSGLEFRSAKFWQDSSIDISIIRTTGIRKNKTASWTETAQTTSTNLAYTSLHGTLSNISVGIGGLYTSKDSTDRVDDKSNGFAAPLAEPRVLGGYSSFLLYQSIYFPNDRVFYEFAEKQVPGFENKGQRMFGLQIGHQLFQKSRGDIFLNRSSSEMGNGTEIIGKLTRNFEDDLNGFISGSLCYAIVNSNRKTVLITEPFSQSEKQKEFLRIYISAGFQF